MELVKRVKMCLFWAFTLIFSLQHTSVQNAASDSEGFVYDFKIILAPLWLLPVCWMEKLHC